MGCTRSRSKIWVEWVFAIAIAFYVVLPSDAWAIFASQFSLSAGEEYNDNIFFSKSKEHDFVTSLTPVLTLLYAPPGQVLPTLNLNVGASGQIYARRSDLNNFGDNVFVNGGYSYQYSPRLNFNLSDTFQRQGPTRTAGFGGVGQFQSGPTSGVGPGNIAPPPLSQNLNHLISAGDQLTNWVSFSGSYLYRPDISFTGGYTNAFTSFITAGGTDVFHTANARGIYNWRQDHNLHAGYTISIGNSRNGDNSVVHNFDIGDDYFSNYNLQLTPTLSLAASTGMSFNTGDGGPRVANNTSVTITKLWQTAQLNAGVRKGLTPSFGVSGISDTTSLFTNFNLRLTEKLSTYSNVNFSFYDTEDVNFKTFQAGLGLQYAFTSWLSSALSYNFNWIDGGAGANSTDLLNKGVVKSNSVFLSMTTRFDLWPNTGLARGMASPTLTPVIQPPFPMTTTPPSTPSPLTTP
jgi:hypothetical protein